MRRHHSVVSGKAPGGAVLRLTKTFETKTSTGRPSRTSSSRRSSCPPAASSRGTSTRPPGPRSWSIACGSSPRSRCARQTTTKSAVVWRPGDHVDVPFTLSEGDVGALKVNLDWPTPDDLDLDVYYVQADGSLLEVGSSGNFVLDKEEALIELPEPGNYVVRAVNYASVTTTFTMTVGVYGSAGEDVSGGGIVESYTLTCERPNGTVLQTVTVAVDRGGAKKLTLSECSRRFKP